MGTRDGIWDGICNRTSDGIWNGTWDQQEFQAQFTTYSTVQYSTAQYSTVVYSTLQYSTVQYRTVHMYITLMSFIMY